MRTNPFPFTWVALAAIAFGLTLAYGGYFTRAQPVPSGTSCPCKPEIKGRQLYASLCQSSSIKGPVLQECLYR